MEHWRIKDNEMICLYILHISTWSRHNRALRSDFEEKKSIFSKGYLFQNITLRPSFVVVRKSLLIIEPNVAIIILGR